MTQFRIEVYYLLSVWINKLRVTFRVL